MNKKPKKLDRNSLNAIIKKEKSKNLHKKNNKSIFNGSRNSCRISFNNPIPTLNLKKTLTKNFKESTGNLNITYRESKPRNSLYSNFGLMERNKSCYNLNFSKINSTNKKECKYKKIIKKSGTLFIKKHSSIISDKKNNDFKLKNTVYKNEKLRNYKHVLKQIKLFSDNSINDSNTLDIKSYETALEIPPSIPESQEKQLTYLSSSLLIITQNDELLYNNNFEERLESSFEFIIEYLSIKDLFRLALINKEFFKMIIRYLLEKIEIKVQDIKEKINEIKIKSRGFINLKEKEFKNFEKNELNERAMNLIDSISKKKLFKEKSSLMNNKDIILLFELFFISLGKKYDIMQFDTNDEDTKIKRWSYFCQYFNQNKNEYLKNIIEKALFNGKFSNEKINALYNWSFEYLDKIKPNHFQLINKDIAIFSYIIKDLLDYFGISKESKVNYQKLYTLYSIRLNVNEKIVSKFNQMLIKFD